MMIKSKKINNILIILLFIILSFMSCVILYNTHFLFGAGDMQFHLKRIIELENSFKHGDLLPLFSFNEFHGSSVLTLYPYLNLFPIILLSVFINSNITLIYIFFGLNVLLSLISSYYSSLSLSKSKYTSITFAIIYSLSISFLTYGFYNMDLGVLTSISIFPLVCFGFISLIRNNKWMMFTIGFTLVIFSHVLSTIIICGFLIIIVITNYKKLFNKIFWVSLFKAIVLMLLLTSIVWIPALRFGINNLNTYPPNPVNLVRTNISSLIENGLFDHITYGLNIIAVIGIIIPWIPYKMFYRKFNFFTKQMYWVSVIIVTACSLPIWKITNYGIFKIFRIFQFTWRFYIIPELLLCYIVSICITKCIRSTNIKYILMLNLILLSIGCQLLGQYRLIHESINSPLITRAYVNKRIYNKKRNVHHMKLPIKQFHFIYYKNPEYPYYKLANERELKLLTNTYTDENTPDYYPIKSLSKIDYINNNKATYDYNRRINVKHTGYNQFSFNSPKKINRLILPLLHYNGEHLRMYVNHRLVHSYTNYNSLVTLDNVKKGLNNIRVQYIPNMFLVIIKSILFLLGMIWIIWYMVKSYARL